MSKAEETEKDWHDRMHREVVTYPDPDKSTEENCEIHAAKLAKWLKKNPPPKPMSNKWEFIVKINPFEAGFLMDFLERHEDERSEHVLKNVMDQLIKIQKRKLIIKKAAEFIIKINPFEGGFLINFLWKNRDERSEHVLKNVWNQLMKIQSRIRANEGVKTEKLPNGLIRMIDRRGTTIIRAPYEWEKENEG